MVKCSVASDVFISRDFDPPARHFLAPAVRAVVAIGLSALAAGWISHRLPLPAAAPQAVRTPAAAATQPIVVAIPDAALFDPGFAHGSAPFLPARRVIAESNSPPAPKQTASLASEGSPSPPARPVDAPTPPGPPPSARHLASSGTDVVPAAPSPDSKTLEKLFGGARTSLPALAYASAESGPPLAGVYGPSARYDRWTAVYDLTAHTVYLPNGQRLEAHSGLGDRLDDPAHVNERNRGATPPHVYELASLDQPFHGVHALRLNPIGDGGVFGRDGLLAHTYMLGPKGDSNGCVVFRNYAAFLAAYQTGQVKRLAVVARLD
jgi:hypothetical protein